MTWQIALGASTVIAAAYLAISVSIVLHLARTRQLWSNPLGCATATIFFSFAVHHGAHAVQLLLPSLGLAETQGLALRAAWGWPLAVWDVVAAVIGLTYWSLRRRCSSPMQGVQLFEDPRAREQQARELNDAVLQGLVVAKMALDLDQPRRADDALTPSIRSASRIITDLVGSSHPSLDLLRTIPVAAADQPEPAGSRENTEADRPPQ